MTPCVVFAIASPLLAVLVAFAGWWVAKRWWHSVADEQLHDSTQVWSRILPHVFVGGAIALGFLTLLYGGCGVFAHCCWESQFCGAAWKSPPWALVSGVAVAPALILLWHWRTVQRGKDQQQRDRELEQHERELKQQDQVAMSSRFSEAAKLLSGEGFDRLGGVYALEQVARDAPGTYRSLVIKTLCTYVRSYQPEGTAEPHESSYEVYEAALAAVRVREDGNEELDFSGAFLNDVDFTNAKLRGANFNQARLTEASFMGADLQRADLGRAMASRALFSRANLVQAVLYEADLSRANLSNADLARAVLSDADLQGARLYGTNLEGASMEGVKYTGADLTYAIYNRHTTFPDDSFNPAVLGMKKKGAGATDASERPGSNVVE